MSTEQTELNRILEIIAEIGYKSATSDYIYRGEPECYPKVSSNLYRELEDANLLHPHLKIEDIQKTELEDAKGYGYIKKTDDFDILSEIQHFGGKTNLLDFTCDYRVAIFFACERFPFNDGRIILQDKNGIIKDCIRTSQNVVQGSRPDVQKSIFVQPPEGFIEPDKTIVIPNSLKQPILKYLEDEFDISTERIYPDLHGFVSRQKTRLGTYKELGKGNKCRENGDAEDDLTKKNNQYEKAIGHYTNAIQQMPGIALAYIGRGFVYSSKDDPDNALADYDKALELDQNSKEAYKGRSAVYRAKDEIDKAIDDAVKLVELDPSDAAAHCALYLAYWDKNDFENASVSISEAIHLKPDQSEFYFSRGDIYFTKRDFDNAIKDYNKAMELNLNSSKIYYNRGLAYILQREWTKAKYDLIKARDLKMDITVEFSKFGSIENLEQEIGIQLPPDIVEMLTPPQS